MTSKNGGKTTKVKNKEDFVDVIMETIIFSSSLFQIII